MGANLGRDLHPALAPSGDKAVGKIRTGLAQGPALDSEPPERAPLEVYPAIVVVRVHDAPGVAVEETETVTLMVAEAPAARVVDVSVAEMKAQDELVTVLAVWVAVPGFVTLTEELWLDLCELCQHQYFRLTLRLYGR